MAWPENANVNTTIIHDNFYAGLEIAATQRFYNRLTVPKTQQDIVAIFTSLGTAPEPRQLSGILGGGPREAALLKDWTVTSTINEWESTVYARRLVAQSAAWDAPSRSRSMSFKAMKTMDKTLMVSAASTTALGYDGVALYSTAHPESGTNQTNTSNTTAATGTNPTAAEVETALTTGISQLKGATDDQGTPVCEGVGRYIVVCHPTMEFAFRTVISPLMSNQAVDSSGVTGKFRGLVDLIVSAYCTSTGLTGGTVDRAFLYAHPDEVEARAMAVCTLADWEFSSNIGDDTSDEWHKGYGFMRSWAAFAFVPWNWQATQRLIFT